MCLAIFPQHLSHLFTTFSSSESYTGPHDFVLLQLETALDLGTITNSLHVFDLSFGWDLLPKWILVKLLIMVNHVNLLILVNLVNLVILVILVNLAKTGTM